MAEPHHGTDPAKEKWIIFKNLNIIFSGLFLLYTTGTRSINKKQLHYR
jgi:hypothetical protein